MRWVELKGSLKAVSVIRKVILRLRTVGPENLEAIGERDAIVLVFFDGGPQLREYLLGMFFIGRIRGAQGGHVHVRAHAAVHIVIGHGIMRGLGGVGVHVRIVLAHVHSWHGVVSLRWGGRGILRLLRGQRKN